MKVVANCRNYPHVKESVNDGLVIVAVEESGKTPKRAAFEVAPKTAGHIECAEDLQNADMVSV